MELHDDEVTFRLRQAAGDVDSARKKLARVRDLIGHERQQNRAKIAELDMLGDAVERYLKAPKSTVESRFYEMVDAFKSARPQVDLPDHWE